ncbi:hypothetical protein [Rhodoplanes sp. Z2-YC6860]|jgi:hypothetical protein|uniref:hypothetical protein n=1 Tax=Rhodoplanes sp. Z2-YC6860 TaxID=674703 RepID=UPI000832BA77|nr:hypothetical protein [Rhodoplanes sp. Z2-YC6860]
MGTVDLSLLAKGGLSAKQKAAMKKDLMGKKRKLAAEIKAIDKRLKALAGKKKKKARAKR